MTASNIKKGDRFYFEDLIELQNFSSENGKPKEGFKVESKQILVVTKL